jgi:hypothetical protein
LPATRDACLLSSVDIDHAFRSAESFLSSPYLPAVPTELLSIASGSETRNFLDFQHPRCKDIAQDWMNFQESVDFQQRKAKARLVLHTI